MNMPIKTKRLRILPLTDDELRAAKAAETDPHMKAAYAEMLEGCLANPDRRLWYTEWRITLAETGAAVGGAGFKGPQVNGAVEIGYGIDADFRGRDYATEAVGALVDWAFSQGDVYFIHAETDPENTASKRVLEKLNFSPAGMGSEGPLFRKERPLVSWTAIFLCLGLSVGLTLGLGIGLSLSTAINGAAIGLSIGVSIGLALGTALDSAVKKNRKAIRAALDGSAGREV